MYLVPNIAAPPLALAIADTLQRHVKRAILGHPGRGGGGDGRLDTQTRTDGRSRLGWSRGQGRGPLLLVMVKHEAGATEHAFQRHFP